MYDTLTKDELSRLADKLLSGGKALGDSATAIHHTMIYLAETGRIEVGSDAWNGLSKARERIVAVMDELLDLMSEANDLFGERCSGRCLS